MFDGPFVNLWDDLWVRPMTVIRVERRGAKVNVSFLAPFAAKAELETKATASTADAKALLKHVLEVCDPYGDEHER